MDKTKTIYRAQCGTVQTLTFVCIHPQKPATSIWLIVETSEIAVLEDKYINDRVEYFNTLLDALQRILTWHVSQVQIIQGKIDTTKIQNRYDESANN